MTYSRETLTAALIYAIPNGEAVIESVGLPKAIDEAAIALFRTQDMESEESQAVREALEDLRATGHLTFS